MTDTNAPEPPSEQPRTGIFADLTPLKHSPAFARLWAGNAVAGIGTQMTIVAVGLHIYDLTRSTFAVSLVALFALVPMLVFGLYGGMLADAFDRRTLALVTAVVAWCATLTLALLAWLHVDQVWPFYLVMTVNTVAATVLGTTRQAILPRLLPVELLPAASALSGISAGVMVTVGPALAGVLVASVGVQWTFTTDAVLFAFAFAGIASLPSIKPQGEVRSTGFASVVEGLRFLRTAPNIRMSFIVDIVAMTFGQPRVMFPAVGMLLLGGGAVTVGVLTAGLAVGAFITSVFSGRLGALRHQGRAIRTSIAVYGGAILAFGVVLLVTSLSGGVASEAEVNWPALITATLCMVVAGGSDNVSSIFRMTILQASAPDEMRGRMQGIFTVVVTGGPRVGDLVAGSVTALTALWVPPLVGGIVIIVVVWMLVRTHPRFAGYDALDPQP
ncbi:MFS transporter [Microbacterium sp. MPKO10]|uniref:MFS transporter n=1 Tax=Microbacterium sp. MPKO10 TaxID=2989818 RepID=UPI002236A3F7|nr:MFS transporter [Microbacterium sp. MPKO10]MCW4459184.1 MFS transporter [Microbacterium sp. MPKO10]